jgi:hypothetical protein
MPGRAVRQPRFAELQKHSGYDHGRMRISVLDTSPIVAGSSARIWVGAAGELLG